MIAIGVGIVVVIILAVGSTVDSQDVKIVESEVSPMPENTTEGKVFKAFMSDGVSSKSSVP